MAKFFLEISRQPIYQRIIENFTQALSSLGHGVVLGWPENCDPLDYLIKIHQQNVDYCLITNPISRLNQYSPELGHFLFELLEMPLVFIHHDSIFATVPTPEAIGAKLTALMATRAWSTHFCLESWNIADLESLGIPAFPVRHASEFFADLPETGPAYPCSFVGHVMAGISNHYDYFRFSHWLKADCWNRLVDFGYSLEPSALRFARHHLPDSDNLPLLISLKHSYISQLHLYSIFLRGEVIKRIEGTEVAIIGGPPPSGPEDPDWDFLTADHVRYYPPTPDYQQAQAIYRHSCINLNITSLQFDTAVINRVIDIGACGGFVLTDWKPDLASLTSVAQEISYRSIEELNSKIAYYQAHPRQRQEVAAQLAADIRRSCSYPQVTATILEHLEAS